MIPVVTVIILLLLWIIPAAPTVAFKIIVLPLVLAVMVIAMVVTILVIITMITMIVITIPVIIFAMIIIFRAAELWLAAPAVHLILYRRGFAVSRVRFPVRFHAVVLGFLFGHFPVDECILRVFGYRTHVGVVITLGYFRT